MSKRASLAISLPALLCASAAVAQSPQPQANVIDLDTITVTAARTERSTAETPQSIQVLDRAQIEEQLKFSPNAAAALGKLVPGYSMATQTVSSASENYRGRDLLVLIDGVPMNTPLRDVSRILSLIDLNTVERIEMVAGASSLYGAGATGGTVNFITKKAADGSKPRVTVNTAVRGFTQALGRSLAPEASVTVSGKIPDGFDYLISGSGRGAGRTYDGAGRELPSDGLLGQGGGDRYKAGNLLAKLGYDFDASKRIELQGSLIAFDQDPKYLTSYAAPFARPDRTRLYTGENVIEDTKSVSLRYSDSDFALGKLSLLGYYNDIKKRFNYSTFSYPYNSQVYYSFNPASPTSPDNQTTLYSQRGGVNLTIDTPLDRLLPGAKFTWGGDLSHEKTWQTLTNGQDVFTPLKQTTSAAFGQLQIPIGERITLRGDALRVFLAGGQRLCPPGRLCGGGRQQCAGLPELRAAGAQRHRWQLRLQSLDRQSRRDGQALREQRGLRRLLAGLRTAGCRRLYPPRRHFDRLRLPGRQPELPAGQPAQCQLCLDRA